MKQTTVHIISAVFAGLVLLSTAPVAHGQRTTRKGLRIETGKKGNGRDETKCDTIAIDGTAGTLSVAGYDKPLRSTRETFFVTNNTDSDISGIRVRLEYFDTHGRTLHQRETYIPMDLPAGATRQAQIKSWDQQKSFYYKLSSKPRRSDGTQYDVKCTVISATIKPE